MKRCSFCLNPLPEGRKKYCSARCIKTVWYKLHLTPKNNPPRPCIICGKIFVKKFILDAKTCDKKCSKKLDYKKNKDRYIKRAAEWLKANPEKRREIYRKNYHKYIIEKRISQRIRKMKSDISKSDWFKLCNALNFQCQLCFKTFPYEKLTIDHRIPISKGGTSSLLNIQPLCHGCNARKSNHSIRSSPEKRLEQARRLLRVFKNIA